MSEKIEKNVAKVNPSNDITDAENKSPEKIKEENMTKLEQLQKK